MIPAHLFRPGPIPTDLPDRGYEKPHALVYLSPRSVPMVVQLLKGRWWPFDDDATITNNVHAWIEIPSCGEGTDR